jgi:hypothetical protein
MLSKMIPLLGTPATVSASAGTGVGVGVGDGCSAALGCWQSTMLGQAAKMQVARNFRQVVIWVWDLSMSGKSWLVASFWCIMLLWQS